MYFDETERKQESKMSESTACACECARSRNAWFSLLTSKEKRIKRESVMMNQPRQVAGVCV